MATEKTHAEQTVVANVSFYRFVRIEDPEELADAVRRQCTSRGLLGKVVVAPEGINGMLAGPPGDIDAWEAWLQTDPRLSPMRLKRSPGDYVPYRKLKVRVKPEIVTMGVDDVDVVQRTGRHLAPETFRDWLREGRDMTVVDVRNDYEVGVGSFRGAVDPRTQYFHEFPDWVAAWRQQLQSSEDVVMFCTGGIRCEKATAWMVEQGFENVWQLEGGVHNYFERIDDAERDWAGELFVFDRRVAVDTKLRETSTVLCEECGDPVILTDGPRCSCHASR